MSGRIADLSEWAVMTVETAVRKVFDPIEGIESADRDLFRVVSSSVERADKLESRARELFAPLRDAPCGVEVDNLEPGGSRRSVISFSRAKLSNRLLRTHFPTLTAHGMHGQCIRLKSIRKSAHVAAQYHSTFRYRIQPHQRRSPSRNIVRIGGLSDSRCEYRPSTKMQSCSRPLSAPGQSQAAPSDYEIRSPIPRLYRYHLNSPSQPEHHFYHTTRHNNT